MHVILKSSVARGNLSLSHHERYVICTAHRLGAKLGVKVNDIVVMSNHVHLKVRLTRRRAFAAYFSSLSGLIARKVLNAERGRPSGLRNFFSGRPFSRIIAAGKKSYRAISNYFHLNRLEKCGICKADSRRLKLLDQVVSHV